MAGTANELLRYSGPSQPEVTVLMFGGTAKAPQLMAKQLVQLGLLKLYQPALL